MCVLLEDPRAKRSVPRRRLHITTGRRWVAAVLLLLAVDTLSRAIPNTISGAGISPAGSVIPHEHTSAIASAGFANGTVLRGGAAAAANPDATDHQHRDDHRCVGTKMVAGVEEIDTNRWRFGIDRDPAWAWDNRSLRKISRPPEAVGDPEPVSACFNNADDDAADDSTVNDGCPAVGAAEGGMQCRNAVDDDIPADGAVNDGCPHVGAAAEAGGQCGNAVDDDPNDDSTINDGCDTVFNKGHGFIDRQRLGYGSPPLPITLRYRFGNGRAASEAPGSCGNSNDDEDNDPAKAGVQLDGFTNDGCPVVGNAAESAAQCDGNVNDDAPDDGAVNDGCPQVGAAPEAAAQCRNAADDDGDETVNDGCPQLAAAAEAGAQCANATDDDANDDRAAGVVNDGCAVQGLDAPPAVAQAVIVNAFGQWAALMTGERKLTYGIGFSGVVAITADAGSEISVLWKAIADNGVTTPMGARMEIKFNSGTNWNYGAAAGVGAAQRHFLSTALHEIGHAIGLDHTDQGKGAAAGASGLMRPAHPPGCPAMVCYDNIDAANSAHAALDMYSVPTPDFGDAPATYPTKLEDDGARAGTLAYEWLGARPDPVRSTTTREADGRLVDNDESDDGCILLFTPDSQGVANLSYTISVRDRADPRYLVALSRLYVAAWVDWNRDGDWTNPTVDPKELLDLVPGDTSRVHVDDPSAWAGGIHTMTYDRLVLVPVGHNPGESWLRCRLVYGAGQGPVLYLEGNQGDGGLIPLVDSSDNGGEIEDIPITIPNFSANCPGSWLQQIRFSNKTTITWPGSPITVDWVVGSFTTSSSICGGSPSTCTYNTASCQPEVTGQQITLTAVPPSGAGFYYLVKKDGAASEPGFCSSTTWQESAASPSDDRRDVAIPDCP